MAQELLQQLEEAIEDFDSARVEKISRSIVDARVNPNLAIEAMSKAIRVVGNKFECGEYFLTELIGAAQAFKAGINVLEPILLESSNAVEGNPLHKIVIGTVAGDIHDIGKNIVGAMLMANGFKVIDLGVDVSAQRFVENVQGGSPSILALSALLTSTRVEQKKVIDAIRSKGLGERVRVMIGGAAVDRKWAEEIGADGYGADGTDAVRNAKMLFKS